MPSHTANLGEIKTNLYHYYDTGAYEQDTVSANADAMAYIDRHASDAKKPAIVMDIDETSLSNWPELKANDLTFKMDGPCNHLPKGPCGLTAWQNLALSDPIPGALDVYNHAKSKGVAVFFLTGRDETVRAATERNLRHAGYEGWTKLIMRPAHTKTPSASDYKIPARAKIEAAGYTIIANIGDQPSDLAGGHAKHTFLIPNPFYRIP